MTLAGLWHGASWNFVAWGLIHGVFLCIDHLCRSASAKVSNNTLLMALHSGPVRALVWAVTLLVVCVAWVPFRAPAWNVTLTMLGQMVTWQDLWPRYIHPMDAALALSVSAAAIVFQVASRWQGDADVPRVWYLRAAAYGIMIIGLASMGGDLRSFIYFQF